MVEISSQWTGNALDKQIVVRDRKYEDVLNDLRTGREPFKPGQKILSVGEGLSDFGRKLAAETKASVVSIDPIYQLGRKVLQDRAGKAAKEIRKWFGGKVAFSRVGDIGVTDGDRTRVPLPDRKAIVAASVYELPFENEHFDQVLSFSLLEHVDFSRALPEMTRVLKDRGEIRMGGTHFQLRPDEGKLMPRAIIMVEQFVGRREEYAGGFEQAVQQLHTAGLKAYILVDMAYQMRLSRDPKMRLGTVLIIRKDETIPKIEGFNPESEALMRLGEKVLSENSQQVAYYKVTKV